MEFHEVILPDFKKVFVLRYVQIKLDGTVGYNGQILYNTMGRARSAVHKFKHYATGEATAHIVIYSCDPETGAWQVEHIFEQGENLSKPLPWQKGYKP